MPHRIDSPDPAPIVRPAPPEVVDEDLVKILDLQFHFGPRRSSPTLTLVYEVGHDNAGEFERTGGRETLTLTDATELRAILMIQAPLREILLDHMERAALQYLEDKGLIKTGVFESSTPP